MEHRTVRLERHGRVLLVRLHNPPRNLVDTTMVGDLTAVVRALEADAGVRAVVITGDPHEEFAAHFDVGVIEDLTRRVPGQVPPTAARVLLSVVAGLEVLPGLGPLLARTPAAGAQAVLGMHRLFQRMGRSDKIFIAAVNGLALGGGCEIALACDLRFMAEHDDCRIGLPEALLGIIPGGGGTQLLTRAVGPARAMPLMLHGTALSAAEALAEGIVHRVVPRNELLETALATADRLALRSPWAVRMLKRSVYGGVGRSLGSGLALERSGLVAAATSAQGRRGMRTLLEMFPSDRPVPPGELLAALGRTEIDLGAATTVPQPHGTVATAVPEEGGEDGR